MPFTLPVALPHLDFYLRGSGAALDSILTLPLLSFLPYVLRPALPHAPCSFYALFFCAQLSYYPRPTLPCHCSCLILHYNLSL